MLIIVTILFDDDLTIPTISWLAVMRCKDQSPLEDLPLLYRLSLATSMDQWLEVSLHMVGWKVRFSYLRFHYL